jgi:hypothetical protein
LHCCFTFHTSQPFFPSLHAQDLSVPVFCVWYSSWTTKPLEVKALCVLSEHQETPNRTSVTVFIILPPILCVLPFLVPFLICTCGNLPLCLYLFSSCG